MNEQRLDELFRDKLENYSEIPSPGALHKLNSKLNERKRGAWLNFAKLAAALIVIAVSVYIVQDWDNAQPTPITEQTSYTNPEQGPDNLKEKLQTTSDQNKLDETTNKNPVAVNRPTGKTKNDEATSQIKVSELKEIPEQKSENHSEPVQDIPAPTLTLAKESPEVLDIEQIEATESPQNLSAESVKISRSKVTITYKRSPTPTEPTLALDAQTNEQPKGLKKVWRKALSNYGEISLAGIRGTKDQLLAFERKNKTKESKSN